MQSENTEQTVLGWPLWLAEPTPDESLLITMSDDNEARAQEEHATEGEVIYRAIRRDGDHALAMSSLELAWSGLAAGLAHVIAGSAETLFPVFRGER